MVWFESRASTVFIGCLLPCGMPGASRKKRHRCREAFRCSEIEVVIGQLFLQASFFQHVIDGATFAEVGLGGSTGGRHHRFQLR